MPEAKLRAARFLEGHPSMLCWVLEHDLEHLQVFLRNMESGEIVHRGDLKERGLAYEEFAKLTGQQPTVWDLADIDELKKRTLDA